MPTHFTTGDGEDVAITTTVHLVSDHIAAGLGAGWEPAELCESVVDDRGVADKPKWAALRGHPVSAVYVWRVKGQVQ